MENNNTNISEVTSEETQNKKEAVEQTSSTQGTSTTKKVVDSAGEAVKTGVKVTGNIATAGSGIFAFIASNLQAILIAMAVAAAVAGIGIGIKAMIDANKIKLMDTATVVTEIKKISEFTTYTYIDELLIHEQKAEAKDSRGGLFGIGKKDEALDSLRSEIVLIISGVTKAGYDLGKLTEDDIRISGDTISVNLPAAEIFDVIVNPSNTKTFVTEGKWSHEEITSMQVNCRNQMHQNALERGILKKADEVGKEKVGNLFKALGFKVIRVTTTPVTEPETE